MADTRPDPATGVSRGRAEARAGAVAPGAPEESPQRPRRFRAWSVRRGGALWLWLASALLLGFLLVPLGALVARTLTSGASFSGSVVVDAMRLSVTTTAVTLVITVVAGTPVAYLLARYRFRGHAVLDTLLDVPMVLPPAVAGLALLTAFGRRGVLGGVLEAAGIELAFTTAAVVMAQLFVAAPFFVKAAKAGFEAVDPELERVSATLGVAPAATFLRVTVPLALPGLLSGAVLTWARALGEFGATIMFAGNFQGGTQTMPLAIYTAFESNLGASLSIALILLLVSFSMLLAFKALARRIATPVYAP